MPKASDAEKRALIRRGPRPGPSVNISPTLIRQPLKEGDHARTLGCILACLVPAQPGRSIGIPWLRRFGILSVVLFAIDLHLLRKVMRRGSTVPPASDRSLIELEWGKHEKGRKQGSLGSNELLIAL